MTFAYGAGPDHLPATFHYGMGTFGIRGDLVPSEGENGPSPLYGCVVLPGDAAKEFRLRVTRLPSTGTLVLREDGTTDYTGTPNPWSDSFDGQLQVDGIDFGSTITFPLQIGSGVSVGGNAGEDTDQAGGGATTVATVSVGGNATETGDSAAGGAGPIVQANVGGGAVDGSDGATGGAVAGVVLGSLAGSTRRRGAGRPRNIQTSRR